ncbi:MAG: NAD-dependent epimerase/dehydratase family protein [Ardenticatenaceae bacterium]|nr:NAD-dependent epimerase/dehydratase family protein [Ardenticatenaceae bacterium]
MRKKVILVTGASGEVGHSLIKQLAQDGNNKILSLDLQPLPEELIGLTTHLEGNLLDHILLARIISQYEIDAIYHLAALLSTSSEFTPDTAHQVNVEGTLALLRWAADQSQWRRRPIQFIFPSSIAVYGMPESVHSKDLYQRVREWEWNQPRTMYGCNKLYCEMLGNYYSKHFRQLSAEAPIMLDFRAVRFPGLISAFTLPSGGTSDYAPEMIHAAAKGEAYASFVREDVRIPFMAMPDAARSLTMLAHAPREKLTRTVYNVRGFSLTAGQFKDRVLEAFPEAQISFRPDVKRQAIVDSWPADLDDSAARRDWNWQPEYDAGRAFAEYLIPNIKERYLRS